jgi:hypothetical protein
MRRWIGVVCLVLLVASTAHADIPPPPDRGPPSGSAGGLDFAIQWVSVQLPQGYSRSVRVVVLNGCSDGQPNCSLAHNRNLIGMEVDKVDGQDLQPETGMVQQILDAFANKTASKTIVLEFYERAPNEGTITVGFARD